VTAIKQVCGPRGSGKPFQPITYSGARDTAATKREIKVHNKTGRKLRCW
jgi:hypothetical protein